MIYELSANLFSHDQSAIDDVLDKIKDRFPDMIVVKPGEPDQECSKANLIHCNHDLAPPLQCSLIEHIDNCPDIP